MSHLLPNPNFEQPWTGSHECVVYPIASDGKPGAPYRRVKPQIQKPSGWHVWYVHNHPTWTEPECTYMHRHLTPERIHDGQNAYRIFGPAGPVWGGLRAQVEATPGHPYTLAAHAHAWTNHNDPDAIPGHESCCGDPLCSWGAGRGPCIALFDELPELNGDPWSDALRAAQFTVGIDPTGGTDPLADTVIWSPPWAIYNRFHQLAVTVLAEACVITAFLQQKLFWPFRNNDGYWDSVSLTRTDDEGSDSPQWTPPAFDYAKTAILFGPDASPALRAAGGIACSHPRLKSTDAQSVEDAASGPPDRTIKAVGHVLSEAEGWEEKELRAYIDQFYPGTKLSFIEGASPAEIGVRLLPPLADDVAIGMTDARWRDHFFGEDPAAKLGAYGCVVTACAVILRDVYGTDVTPPILDQLLVNDRVAYVAGNLIDWAGFCSLFSRLQDPIKHNRRLSEFELRSLLQDHAVILRRDDGKHFVVLERVEGEELHVIETWNGQRKVWS
ncbi:MAG: hypothetical protein R6X31_14045, partial [Anaerolineae bacterium]